MGKFKLRVGVYAKQGRRATMEDRHTALLDFNQELKLEDQEKSRSFFGVYDGHGGHVCAEYCHRHLHGNMVKDGAVPADPTEALKLGVITTDKNFADAARSLNLQSSSGTCAIIAYIEDNDLYVANVGDSRAVLSTNGKATALSKDHKPSRPDEKLRIEKCGGSVAKSEADSQVKSKWIISCRDCCCPCASRGPYRVYPGGLAVSRTIGDIGLKGNNYIIADPEIMHHTINVDEDEFLVLACDGVWDVMSNSDVVRCVKGQLLSDSDPREAAQYLTDLALAKGSADNVSVVIITFEREN